MDIRRSSFPSLELESHQSIRFLHPGYNPPTNVLLSLARVDSTINDSERYGVHHRTALVACQIIANNAFNDSYLSLDQAGQQRVTTPLDDILIEREYYFIVGNGPSQFFLSFSLFHF